MLKAVSLIIPVAGLIFFGKMIYEEIRDFGIYRDVWFLGHLTLCFGVCVLFLFVP